MAGRGLIMSVKEYLAWAYSLIPAIKEERQKIEVFIRWAAGPFIADIRPAALVFIPGSNNLAGIWRETGADLCSSWGISSLTLREGRRGILVLLYRRRQLMKKAMTGAAARYLMSLAYPVESGLEACMDHLKTHFDNMENTKFFPHEIGVFLGYPLGDVIGFCSGQYCASDGGCRGYWKVYHRQEKAKRTFARMDAARMTLVRETLELFGNLGSRTSPLTAGINGNSEGQFHYSPWIALR
jgi:hypothetical protein